MQKEALKDNVKEEFNITFHVLASIIGCNSIQQNLEFLKAMSGIDSLHHSFLEN
jgi:hypothetical protein